MPATALMMDSRLSDTARVLGWYIDRRGKGEHEVPYEEFARIAHGVPSERTIGRSLRELEVYGYLKRRPGGRDHANRYTIYPDSGVALTDRPSDVAAYGVDSPPVVAPYTDNPTEVAGYEGGRGEEVEDDDDREMKEKRAGARFTIHANAGRALQQHDELLAGCRGALKDYLRARVPPGRQLGFVQTLAGWREGTDAGVWKKPDGTTLASQEQNRVLAGALNELLAGDETPMKRPEGDPGNLHTKISIKMQQAYGDRPMRNGDQGWKKQAVDEWSYIRSVAESVGIQSIRDEHYSALSAAGRQALSELGGYPEVKTWTPRDWSFRRKEFFTLYGEATA